MHIIIIIIIIIIVSRSFLKQSGGKELKTKKRLPVSKTGRELKISEDGKRCHYMQIGQFARQSETWT